jgi:outer membrane protein OmpA-like peptidoglycan-associated protein
MTPKKAFLLSSVVALSIGMVGCSHKESERPNLQPRTKSRQYASTEINRSEIASWRKELATQNVQLITQGWRLTIILPADRLFVDATTVLRRSAYPLLERVAYFVDAYSHSQGRPKPIKVWGYTDNALSLRGQKSESKQFAQSVASFLWNSGLSRKELSIVGRGIKDPVAPQNTVLGRSYNRRIVIQVN